MKINMLVEWQISQKKEKNEKAYDRIRNSPTGVNISRCLSAIRGWVVRSK